MDNSSTTNAFHKKINLGLYILKIMHTSSCWLEWVYEQTRMCLQQHSVSLAWRLDQEMRKQLIFYTKQDLLVKGILLSTLLTLIPLQRPKIHVRLRSQATRVYKYKKIRRPWLQRNYIIARDQKSDLHGMSFQSSLEINCMLITRPFAYNESLQHPTIAVLLIKILSFSTTQ